MVVAGIFCRVICVIALLMEAISSFEISARIYQTRLINVLEDSHLHSIYCLCLLDIFKNLNS